VVNVVQIGPRLDVRDLVQPERTALLELLTGLDLEDWAARTVCPGWAVRDVVTHLVHDDLRRLSRTRDRYRAGPAPQPGDLDALGEGVWWAGVDPAPVWLDLAREYTESWTHQQQIRDAVGRPGLTEAAYLDPVVDTFVRALPMTYADVPAVPGAVVVIVVDDGRLTWSLHNRRDGWTLQPGAAADPTARIGIPVDTLWRLTTGGITPATAAANTRINGNDELGRRALSIVSVIR
jgi:uncharacterized protein (TIGR03083 family)